MIFNEIIRYQSLEIIHRRVSVTTGTVFHGPRTPLAVWFAVAWYLTSTKNGVAALTLHRLLGFGSYPTVWAMLHRLRRAMVRPGPGTAVRRRGAG